MQIFEGQEKLKFFECFAKKTLRFDPNLLYDSKQLSKNFFGSEKYFMIKEKRSYIDSHE